jgi:hypothetical protein
VVGQGSVVSWRGCRGPGWGGVDCIVLSRLGGAVWAMCVPLEW